jgi:hypothetical protein
MNRYCPDAHWWLGLCRKPPVLHKSPSVNVLHHETPYESRPGSDSGGSGTIGRGTGVALSGIKTLIRNRQLLWFPFFTGLVLAGLFVAHYIIRLLSVYPYDAIDLPHWVVLTFVTELATVFCLSILLAALVLSLSQKEGSPLSFREGLARAKEYLRPLADWSVVMALGGMLIFPAFLCVKMFCFPSMLFPVFNQFPFNFILLPENYHIGPMGGTYAIEAGLTNTLMLSAINLLLFVLTLAVIPQLVLEKKSLKEAVLGSVALMKNIRGEVTVCVIVLGMVVFAASLTALLFQVIYGVVAPGMSPFWYPGDEWIAAALVYMAALSGLVFVMATVGGIATLELYTYAKIRESA